MKEKAEPQTIEGKDGFPEGNINFYGEAQEIMAILDNNKPVAMSTLITKDYKPYEFRNEFIKNGKKQYIDKIKKISYNDIIKKAKDSSLVYVFRKKENKRSVQYFKKENKRSVQYFKKENKMKAYLLLLIYNNKEDIAKYNHKNYNKVKFGPNIGNIVVGIILGYRKEDIRAWFALGGLKDKFGFNYINYDTRSEFIKRPDVQKWMKEFKEEFDEYYEKAKQKLEKLEETIIIPKEWEDEFQTL